MGGHGWPCTHLIERPPEHAVRLVLEIGREYVVEALYVTEGLGEDRPGATKILRTRGAAHLPCMHPVVGVALNSALWIMGCRKGCGRWRWKRLWKGGGSSPGAPPTLPSSGQRPAVVACRSSITCMHTHTWRSVTTHVTISGMRSAINGAGGRRVAVIDGGRRRWGQVASAHEKAVIAERAHL